MRNMILINILLLSRHQPSGKPHGKKTDSCHKGIRRNLFAEYCYIWEQKNASFEKIQINPL